MKRLPLLFCLIVVYDGCSGKSVEPTPREERHVFSFERELEGWSPKSADVEDPAAAWSIERSEEMRREGRFSLRFALDNVTDAGKIWIERSFSVQPGRLYRVSVAYSFASMDHGAMNLWRLITRVANGPATRADLVFKDETGNGSENDIGFKWLEKSYEFIVPSNSSGVLFVDVGVWGTWETLRTYYFDEIVVAIDEIPG